MVDSEISELEISTQRAKMCDGCEVDGFERAFRE